MSLVRVQTVWTGVAGSPFYTNLYALGPLSTGNGAALAAAFNTFLASLSPTLRSGLTATIDGEHLEFNETDGIVTGAEVGTTHIVGFSGGGDILPTSNQLLVQWQTPGIVHNRRVRGRMNLPGALESHNAGDGKPLPILGTPVTTGLTAMLTTMSGRMRVWSQPFVQKDPNNTKNPTRPGSAHQIQGFTVAPYWAILRSRRD